MFVWLSFGSDGWLTLDRLFTNVLGTPRLPKGAPPEILANIEKCLRRTAAAQQNDAAGSRLPVTGRPG